jgi:chemotaxis methyl-accepting protein methylase
MIPVDHAPPTTTLPWAVDEPCTEGTIAALRAHTGIDVAAYRRPTIERRILNRMISLGEHSHHDYLERLRESRDEAFRLLDRVSIKVSAFYRNPGTFDLLRERVLPGLAMHAAGRPLRIWSAGCGRGEEAWTLAMLLDNHGIAGTVIATDIDPGALEHARARTYVASAVASLPSGLATRYLDVTGASGGVVRVSPALSARVQYSQHDILTSAPPAEAPFDLICCRNVLIYFQREAQERAVLTLRRSLSEGGTLCLGEAEWPCGIGSSALSTLSAKERLFRADGPGEVIS